MSLDLILCDIQAPMVLAWRKAFRPHPEVEIVHGSLIDISADAYISPANSFGIMDGGIDVVLRDRFPLVESRVQGAIAAMGAPIPVGQSLIVGTGDFDVPYLICAPTMKFPSRVAHTNHAYLAMRSILMVAEHHTEITSIAIPGLCTGIGEMHPDHSAAQMVEAYVEWLSESSSK